MPTESYCIECGRVAIKIEVSNVAGRPLSEGGPWCLNHGGPGRAWREINADWNYQAPESVGDVDAVREAGKLHLDTTHAYVVVRRAENGHAWLAWLGVGSKQLQVRRPGAKFEVERGVCTFDDADVAIVVATELWSFRLGECVRVIRDRRGGTLAWGEPIERLPEPVILIPDGVSAWEAARRAETRSVVPPGNSGLYPTGEVL